MTATSPGFDAAVLDALIRDSSNPWYRRGCAVGQFIATLNSGEFRSRLIEHLANTDIGHSTIVRALEATTGQSFRSDTLRRHRVRQCSCGPEVWEP